MTHRNKLNAITLRGALVLLLSCSLGSLARADGAVNEQPVAKAVRAKVAGPATRITIAGTAPMSYSVRRPEERLLVVELPGVDASPLARSYRVTSPLVSGVNVARANGEGVPFASLRVSLRAPVLERSHLSGNELVLELLPASKKAGPLKSATAEREGIGVESSTAGGADEGSESAAQTGATTGTQRPASQGQNYGQPGFVGEPISLNVVNADIRDILNYITEQYGINFVVDKSVTSVPVTINVTDVPWNFALDAILKANRLGVEVNGNILRVADLQTLAQEASVRATEAQAQTRLREAQFENLPLVTEFIRLNYARAIGTLAGAAGSTGGFAGGNTGTSFSGGAGGDALGSSGDQGILPIISRRLSKRGSVEVDGRSNTLIITDVSENIDAIRQLVRMLDQPEPQVEIETRIVVANRSFSRDLGVQLQGAVFGSRGQGAEFSTVPVLTPGLIPGGIPGGLVNTPPPTGGLGASGPNTVIGLTTGIFGTAQISALITAAEQRGTARVVATPRVTALNNRVAQIESGSQIPVVTPQTGGGSAANVFTTTFVSVPLRLSITPQVTDAATVVLRVVMENNSVNGALTNSLGTPGIDTQRMQTEVLVPDGGTTVVGGVLNDREGETQNRTPGLSNIPVLGNLFKRRAVVRSSDEILFFITPRIYRPDYQGRRIEQPPASGPRSTQLPQPVPLGNPPTNTPPPPAPGQITPPQSQAPPTTYFVPGGEQTNVEPVSRPATNQATRP